MKFPISALTSATAPTSTSKTWSVPFAEQNSVKAVVPTVDSGVGVLLWTDGPEAGSAAIATLDVSGRRPAPPTTARPAAPRALTRGLRGCAGSAGWGVLDYGEQHGEGTDMAVSADGSAFLIGGHGACESGSGLCGKLTKARDRIGISPQYRLRLGVTGRRGAGGHR